MFWSDFIVIILSIINTMSNLALALSEYCCVISMWHYVELFSVSVILALICKMMIGFGPRIKNVVADFSPVSNSELATTVSW
jgi:hypothetical protein